MSDDYSLSEEKLQDISLEETRPLTSSIDIPERRNQTRASPLDGFFSKFEILQDEFQEYMVLTKKLKEKRKDEVESGGSAEVSEEAVQEARTKLLSIKSNFQELVRYSKANPVEPNDSEIRQNQLNFFKKKLLKAIEETQKSENEFRNQLKTKSMRQFMIAYPDATEDELAIALDSGNTSHFVQSLVDSTKSEKASDVLDQVQERHQDIKRIENSVIELQILYSQLQELTEQQGPLLEKIYNNVDDTNYNLEEANYELDTASAYSKEARRKKLYFLVFIVGLILILSGAVGVYFLMLRT